MKLYMRISITDSDYLVCNSNLLPHQFLFSSFAIIHKKISSDVIVVADDAS